jgi:O-antigen/teichoic acid export membrane protein
LSKSLGLAKVSARGGFNVLWGLTISSIISAIGVMVVAGILSEIEFGVVTVALIGPTIITTIRDLGIDQAIIKYTTQYKTENKKTRLKSIIVTGTLAELVLGTIFTLISLFLSGIMANILERPTIVPLIQIASFTILADALLKAAQSAFIGYEKMKYHSLTLVFHSIFKTGLMILLVTLNFGAYGAIVGNAISYLSAGAVGVTLLYMILLKKLRKIDGQLQILSTLKIMLKFGLPLSIALMLAGVLGQFYSFLVAIYTTDLYVANYQVAVNFAMLVSIFATSVTTVLFPTFSKLKAKEDLETLGRVFQYSVKYAALLIVPATFAVMALSKPGVETIFGNKYEFTPLYLSLYIGTFLYSALGNLSAGNLINSQGKTQFNLRITTLTFIIGLVVSLILIPQFGVLGLLVTHLTIGMPGILVSLWWINKNYNATIDWKSSVKILTSSTISAIITYLITNQIMLASWIILIVGAAVFLATYIISAPLIGAINYNDTQNLKEMLKSLGPLAPLLTPLLLPIEKITKNK